MNLSKSNNNPSLLSSAACISSVILTIVISTLGFNASLANGLFIAILIALLYVLPMESNPNRIIKQMSGALLSCLSVFYLFILIGLIVAAFVISGAIPSFVYYGLQFLKPQVFLPVGMILCSLMTLCIGTCWGTIGTIGIALLGIARVLHIPVDLAAGMIVSGAYFGDKLSPASDTTVLSALSTHTPIQRHIQGMTYTLIPAYILTLLIFYWIGLRTEASALSNLKEIEQIMAALTQYHISLLTLLPLAILLGLNLFKYPAYVSMAVSLIMAALMAHYVQANPWFDVLHSLVIAPPAHPTEDALLNEILNHGGLSSIASPLILTSLILMLGGLLDSFGFIRRLTTRLIEWMTTPVQLVMGTFLICVLCNILLGEAYLSIVIAAKIFSDPYRRQGLDSCALSKAIEEGAIFSTPLIPWTTSGIFIQHALHISPFAYAPWAILNWLAPLLYLLFVATDFSGIQYFKQDDFQLKKKAGLS